METKECIKCGQKKELSAFYRHKDMSDGHLNKCIECTKRDVKEHREKNLDKVREYDRNRPNKEQRNEDNKRRIKDNKEARAIVSGNWSKRNVEKRRAQRRTYLGVKTGKIIKPDCCQQCGSMDRIEAHHTNYDDHVNVLWVCDPCHKGIHKRERAEKRLFS